MDAWEKWKSLKHDVNWPRDAAMKMTKRWFPESLTKVMLTPVLESKMWDDIADALVIVDAKARKEEAEKWKDFLATKERGQA